MWCFCHCPINLTEIRNPIVSKESLATQQKGPGTLPPLMNMSSNDAYAKQVGNPQTSFSRLQDDININAIRNVSIQQTTSLVSLEDQSRASPGRMAASNPGDRHSSVPPVFVPSNSNNKCTNINQSNSVGHSYVDVGKEVGDEVITCLLYTSPSPRDGLLSRMPSSA